MGLAELLGGYALLISVAGAIAAPFQPQGAALSRWLASMVVVLAAALFYRTELALPLLVLVAAAFFTHPTAPAGLRFSQGALAACVIGWWLVFFLPQLATLIPLLPADSTGNPAGVLSLFHSANANWTPVIWSSGFVLILAVLLFVLVRGRARAR